MSGWNGLDFFIFLILVLNTILGMARGATKEIISLMCLSAALIFCIEFTVPLSNFLNRSPLIIDVVNSTFVQNFMLAIDAGPVTANLLNQIMYSISLLICFVGVFSICEAGLSMTGFVEVFSFPYAALNRKVGGTLGFTRGYIISLIFLSILIMHIYRSDNQIGARFIGSSFFVRLFESQIKKIDELISSQNPENYQQLYQNQPYNEQQLYKTLGKPKEPVPPQQQQQVPLPPVLPQQPSQ